MPELAKLVTVDLKQRKVFVDGVEFPWVIEANGVEVSGLGGDEIRTVTLTIPSEDLQVVPRN
jgi:hypothetical protein